MSLESLSACRRNPHANSGEQLSLAAGCFSVHQVRENKKNQYSQPESVSGHDKEADSAAVRHPAVRFKLLFRKCDTVRRGTQKKKHSLNISIRRQLSWLLSRKQNTEESSSFILGFDGRRCNQFQFHKCSPVRSFPVIIVFLYNSMDKSL